MGVTGITDNKLFKVRTYDNDQPYKIGFNGVTSVSTQQIDSVNYSVIKYEIGDIKYTTYITPDGLDIFNTRGNVKSNINVALMDNYKFSDVINNTEKIKLQQFSLDKSNLSKIKKPSKNSNKVFLKKPLTFINTPIKQLLTRPKNNSNSIFDYGDTLFETKEFSYKQYVDKKINKKEDYVGLIDEPAINPQIFIERDAFAIMERQQRISEIGSLFDLENYKNGYYKNIKTI